MSRQLGSILAVVVLAAIAVTQLPALHLDARILEILPDLPAATDYREYVERFGGIENVFIAIEGRGDDGLETAAEVAHRIAEELEASTLVAAARCGLTADDEAFWFETVLPRALLLEPANGQVLRDRLDAAAIRERIGGMRSRLAGPLGAFEAQLFAADPLGLSADLSPGFADSVRADYDPGLDAFVSHSRDRALVVVTPSFEGLDADAGRRLVEAIETTFAAVRAELAADVGYQAIGGPVYAVHDASIIRADIVRTTVGSALLVFALLLAYFGGVRIPLALTLSLAVAVLWIAGGVAVVRGYLSVFGISFGAILIGLGVDYGIHAASAFRDALASGTPSPAAMGHAVRATAPAILTSAGTTAAAFLVLASSPVAPVREMGWLIAAGIAAVLLASATLGAPLAVLLCRAGAPGLSIVRRRVGWLTDHIVDFAVAHRVLVLAATAALTAIAVVGVGMIQFNADLRRFRPAGSGIEAVERMFVDEFGLDLDTLQLVVDGPDLGAALLRADDIARELRRRLPDAGVESAAQFVPSGTLAERRVAALGRAMDAELPERVRQELDRNGFALGPFERALAVLDAIAAGRVPDDVARAAWPDWIARDIRIEPGRAYVVLRLAPALDTSRFGGQAGGAVEGADWPPRSWLEAVDRIAPDAAVVSVPLLGRELQGAVGGEFRRLLAWAFALVALVVLVSFRGRPLRSVLALTPVAVGSLWLLGLCGWTGLRIDSFSVMVAPVLLGIGIDDGLHALHGLERHGSLAASVRRVGRAMVATTLTTAAGFGSLLLSRAPALQQAGFLVATGTLFCLVVSLLLLPALGRPTPRPEGEPGLQR